MQRGPVGARGHRCRREALIPKPFGRQVDAAGLPILDHIARDVRELEGEAKVAGMVEQALIAGLEHASHHQADHAGDMVAVVERVPDAFVTPFRDIHREAVDERQRFMGGNGMAGADTPQRLEGRIGLDLAATGGDRRRP